MAIEVHLPVAVRVQERLFDDRAHPHAPFDRPPLDPPLLGPHPPVRDHDDVVGIRREPPDDPERVHGRQMAGLLACMTRRPDPMTSPDARQAARDIGTVVPVGFATDKCHWSRITNAAPTGSPPA